ncbi:hypothetical protein Fmac_006279 [Flemingia macrophylla]|uniref:Uncharacterized protein n=1 Tax=Flemingia macrophylla TaxID=520843 RepID=A0ABD1NA45_9FABA
MHGVLKLVNAVDVASGLGFVLVEERGYFCVGGTLWVPFQYQRLRLLHEPEAILVGKAQARRR